MSHRVDDSPNSHLFQIHSQGKTSSEESSRLAKFEKKTSHASSRSFNDHNSRVEKSDKPPLHERKSKNLNIQESNQSRKPLSLEQLHLDKINELMSNPKRDVLFRAKLEHHIVEYEKALKEKGGWPWVRHVALSFFDKISSPALEAIKYNSNIDKSSPNFKALLDSFQNPKNEYRVKDAVFSIGGDVFAYSGGVLNGLPNQNIGYQIIQYEDGRTFAGQLKDGMPHGEGSMRWSDKTEYKGAFQNGKPHGKGELINSNGSSYEGEFYEGKKHGAGKFTYKEGSVFEGEYFKGDLSRGQLTLTNGVVYDGDFKKGTFEGEGKITLQSGVVYEGKFQNGKFEGKGKLTLTDKTVIEGSFKNGEIVAGEMKDLNGVVYKGPFKNGKPDTSHGIGVKGVLKKGEAVYTGKFLEGRLIHGKVHIKDHTYIGGFDKKGNFNGTVSVNGGLPKRIKNATNVGIQDSFNFKETQISEIFDNKKFK